MLMHCVRTPTWPEDLKRLEDAFEEAKSKKIMTAHGASCHGLQALREFPGMQWLDVALLRMNHNGVRMDTLQMRDTDDVGDVNEVVAHAKKIKEQGTGLLGMKLIGEGRFTNAEDRARAIKFAFDTGGVDAVTIGFKNTAKSMKRSSGWARSEQLEPAEGLIPSVIRTTCGDERVRLFATPEAGGTAARNPESNCACGSWDYSSFFLVRISRRKDGREGCCAAAHIG